MVLEKNQKKIAEWGISILKFFFFQILICKKLIVKKFMFFILRGAHARDHVHGRKNVRNAENLATGANFVWFPHRALWEALKNWRNAEIKI